MLIFSSNSQGIIIRHDVAPERYLVLESVYPSIFFLERIGNRRICAATLVDAWWAITAAHCIEQVNLNEVLSNGDSYEVIIAGEKNYVDKVVFHPDFYKPAGQDVDLALLRIKHPRKGLNSFAIGTEEVVSGVGVSFLGWGYSGIGTTGRNYTDGELRMATNRITSDSVKRLRIRFDDPRTETSDPLEGMPSLGDSGGPVLMSGVHGLSLVGIIVGQLKGVNFSEERQGEYGSIAVFERVAPYLQWLERVIEVREGKKR
ncbi:MAG: S1 family peptidase [Gammaproteobacteria bacterium]|nr:S1 family peptidase [Gammaproteobacteria bacterium]